MSWVNESTPQETTILVEDASIALREAVKLQNNIGWEQVFQGQLSKKWSELYNYDLHCKKNEQKYMTAEKWGRDLILILWKFVYDCWNCRNEIEHDLTGDPVKAKKEKKILHIQWIVKNSKVCQKHSYYNEEKDNLIKLPLNNLQMMEHQLNNLAKTDKERKQPNQVKNNLSNDNREMMKS
jgi:hypothetical protein